MVLDSMKTELFRKIRIPSSLVFRRMRRSNADTVRLTWQRDERTDLTGIRYKVRPDVWCGLEKESIESGIWRAYDVKITVNLISVRNL